MRSPKAATRLEAWPYRRRSRAVTDRRHYGEAAAAARKAIHFNPGFAEERGTRDLKGVPEPVTLFELIRASGGGRRSGQRNLTPLVGRDEEIAMLMRRWERTRQGEWC